MIPEFNDLKVICNLAKQFRQSGGAETRLQWTEDDWAVKNAENDATRIINLKISMLSKRSLLQSTYYRVHLDEIPKQAKLIYADSNQGWGRGIDDRGAQGNFWSDGNVLQF